MKYLFNLLCYGFASCLRFTSSFFHPQLYTCGCSSYFSDFQRAGFCISTQIVLQTIWRSFFVVLLENPFSSKDCRIRMSECSSNFPHLLQTFIWCSKVRESFHFCLHWQLPKAHSTPQNALVCSSSVCWSICPNFPPFCSWTRPHSWHCAAADIPGHFYFPEDTQMEEISPHVVRSNNILYTL